MDVEAAPAVHRLTSIGLPPRPAGWVPEQALTVSPEEAPVATVAVGTTDVAAGPVDRVRLGLASRLPDWAALRVERMSSGAFLSAVLIVAALAVSAGVAVHRHSAPRYPSYEASGPDPTISSSATDATFDGSSLVVDVEGKVRRPGLVTLPIGARVADAVKAAGGPRHHRDLAGIDLAQRVADGELLTIGRRAGRAAARAGSKLVHLSTASLTRLETLPGVGPVTAQKILDWRNAHGGFTAVAQLQQVSGIGPARYAQLSPLVAP